MLATTTPLAEQKMQGKRIDVKMFAECWQPPQQVSWQDLQANA